MPTDGELLDSPVGKISIDGYFIQFASLRTIYKNRHNETLLIIIKGHDNQNIIYNYKEFSKLQAAQKGLALLEIQEKAARRAAAEANDQITFNHNIKDTNNKMQAAEIIKLVNSTLKEYDGNVGGLGSFLVNLEIIEASVPAEHVTLAVKCIRGKLQGAAAGFVPENISSYSEIKDSLKRNIKREPSAVVESKLAAIRFDNRNLTQFTEDVEKTASLLSQTFISEGIPIAKANELTISRVIETCRKSARNDLVRSVLASSQFDTPKAVLSKFVVEVAEQNKDKQFLAFQQQRGKFRNENHRFNPRGGGSYNHGWGSFNRGGRGSYYNDNNIRGGFNHRGRGQYNNRGGSNNYRGGGQYNSRGGADNNRPNHVRLIQEGESENEEEARWPMQ